MVFLGDWSAKGRQLHLCEHRRFHLKSLKLILKDRIICLYSCSEAEENSSQLTSLLFSIKTLAWWRHWLWKVWEHQTIINATKKGKKKKPNKTQVYALIISQLLRSRSPNCWWQVKQSKDLNDSNVSNHIKTTIVGQRTVSLTATRLIVWLVVVYIQTAHIYQEKHAETFGALIWAVNRQWA